MRAPAETARPAAPGEPRVGGEPRPGGVRRRAAVAATALAATAFVLPACGGGSGAADPMPGSTLDSTLIDQNGDGFLEAGPGEPFIDRGGRGTPGRVIATFGQLTDTHVRDEESPARVPFLDRIGGEFNSTFRPQEAFSTQVLDAAVRALNRERPQAVFVTGDIVDNAQENEVQMAVDTLDGRTVDPNSGGPGYEGVQAPDDPDPFYYRPDHDAPEHPGALDEAQRRFKAEGLEAPWYPLVGNHDVLAEGEVPPTPAIDAFATGDRLVESLDPRLRPPREETQAKQAVAAVLSGAIPLPAVHTTPDPQRRMLTSDEVEQRLIAASAKGVAAPGGLMDYAVDVGPRLRAITLDTVRRDGTSQGRLTPAQIDWLRAQLQAAGSRYVIVLTHNPLDSFREGAQALQQLDGDPRVVAAIAGNRHKNVITRHHRFWLIGTSSLADFPQQSRMFRLREAPHGVVLETWMVDHDATPLAGISEELSYLDAQGGRPQHFAGTRRDRNARLYVP
jgi:hypothetical protein